MLGPCGCHLLPAGPTAHRYWVLPCVGPSCVSERGRYVHTSSVLSQQRATCLCCVSLRVTHFLCDKHCFPITLRQTRLPLLCVLGLWGTGSLTGSWMCSPSCCLSVAGLLPGLSVKAILRRTGDRDPAGLRAGVSTSLVTS